MSGLSLSVIALTTLNSTKAAAEGPAAVNSNATITAIAGTDPVRPVDPNKPTDPGDGNGGVTPEQSGPLQINVVPNLYFGDQIKITPGTLKTSLKNEKTPYAQISDLRGTGAGWSLNVSLANFTSTQGKTINGAKISFTGGEAVTSNQSNDNAALTNDITLSAGDTGKQPLMKATAGNGRGTWVARYTNTSTESTGNTKIVFEAPSDKIDANTSYTAVLTWQLTDTPAN